MGGLNVVFLEADGRARGPMAGDPGELVGGGTTAEETAAVAPKRLMMAAEQEVGDGRRGNQAVGQAELEGRQIGVAGESHRTGANLD
jgi:hypothetical protein